MPKYRCHQRVRVARLLTEHTNLFASAETPHRRPVVGEVGFVVDVYKHPHEAYCVELADAEGVTIWLADFLPAELELEPLKDVQSRAEV